ncbi:reprolysin-like metallopeptidase [Robiginitalea sp. SC105]|uniref:reprolysin-like metallopeptidase n=1 Tax=Robiginitalea sp. SC105 TaxID=2762332 RepID=UPI001639FE4E|nr:zinc-dependent metalloprotease family protein [Robiginitalea sp. SC105]MBC2838542.1 proprotein convertase P-domain-containing protein [Robiginitalea sp. SC105]
MKTNLRLVFSIAIFLLSFCSIAQETPGFWQSETTAQGRLTASGEELEPRQGKAFILDEEGLRQALAPLQGRPGATVRIYFPDANGKLQPYRVTERSVMAPELQRRYPDIRSYLGTSSALPGRRIRFSLSPSGFQGMISEPGRDDSGFLEKVPGGNREYLLFKRDQKEALPSAWKCGTQSLREFAKPAAGPAAKLVDDQLLRTYRLAVAATGEYTTYHGGTVSGALSAINATLTRINEVFETDLAISLQLVASNDQVIYPDPSTDPFGGNFSSEVQTTLDSQIGSASYDIGHLFHRGSEAGNAGFIGAVCSDGRKGSAYAATPTPEGDRFDLDFVAHEMGHQFGANHTWSFDSEGSGVQAEPASGTTIMGYAGIVEGNDVAQQGDDYFHYFSIVQITQYIAGTSCGSQAALTNSPPVVTPLPDYIIPAGTAFVLEAQVTDPDVGDVLTYAWEQIDDGVVTTASFGPTNPSGANFRSLPPGTAPTRYFPNLNRVATGDLTQVNPATGSAWETVSEIERDLNFALTVRDNAPGGGQVASDLVTVQVIDQSDAFRFLSQQSAQSYAGGSIQTLTWETGDTNQGPIDCQEVDIYLSLDGGQDFPVLLASGVPNTGNAQVQLPGMPTVSGRFMVKASNNIFFAVNRANFTITEQPFVLSAQEPEASACQPADGTFAFTYNSFGGFNEEVTLGISGLPPGLGATFSSPTVQADGTGLLLTMTNTAAVTPGIYPLVISGTAPGGSFNLPFQLRLADGSYTLPSLDNPADGATDTSLEPALQWQATPEATSYRLQLATDAGFTGILIDQEVYSTEYRPVNLLPDTSYFWRVRPVNGCGEGPFGAVSTFRTIATDCKTLSAQGTPVNISATGTPTITSSIIFADDRPVIGARVSLDLSHSYLADLIITLRSPAGTEVTLVSNSCAEANNILATFDADAPPFACGNNPAISGLVRPVGSLNAFNGESSFGEWVLTVEDTAPADGGALNVFNLELCVEGQFRPDADGDGVFDDGDDLCPGTPAGTVVDANGCPVYRFAPDQFEIAISGEKCVGTDDGALRITASQALDYTVTLQGNGIDQTADFNSSYEFRNLATGSYQACITGTNGTITYEPQCFDIRITSPEPLSVLVGRSADGSALNLDLDGAVSYVVSLNGVDRLVGSGSLRLDLADGTNDLKVTAIPSCKGSYQATYFNAGEMTVAPNPFVDEIGVYVPDTQEMLTAQLFNAAGRLVFRARRQPRDHEVRFALPVLPPGMYILRLEQSGSRVQLIKLFRQ